MVTEGALEGLFMQEGLPPLVLVPSWITTFLKPSSTLNNQTSMESALIRLTKQPYFVKTVTMQS